MLAVAASVAGRKQAGNITAVAVEIILLRCFLIYCGRQRRLGRGLDGLGGIIEAEE